jgi:hypothetical protein
MRRTQRTVPEPPLVKIAFRDADGEVETLWPFDLGDHRYLLDNSPWYQGGVSWKDRRGKAR